MRIYKFPLTLTAVQSIAVPVPFKPLSVQLQNAQICLWAETPGGEPTKTAEVVIVGTGHEVPDEAIAFKTFVDTVQQGGYVWHVYAEHLR